MSISVNVVETDAVAKNNPFPWRSFPNSCIVRSIKEVCDRIFVSRKVLELEKRENMIGYTNMLDRTTEIHSTDALNPDSLSSKKLEKKNNYETETCRLKNITVKPDGAKTLNLTWKE